MTDDQTRTWLITGCSSGLGRALAEAVLARGDRAVVTARDTAKLADLAEQYPNTALPVSLDVTDSAQVRSAVTAATGKFGAVDVLVNNAGYGYRAAIEEGEEEDVQKLFATNVFGPIAVLKAVLPGMRSRRRGAIFNVSSIGVRQKPAGSGYYASTKAALEGLTGALRRELEPLGISATVVEPGSFRTDFAGRSLTQSDTVIDDYADTAGKRRKENDTTHGTQPGDPAKGAAAIIRAAVSDDPPALLLLGTDALQAVTAALDAEREEIAAWREVSASTDITD